MQLGSLVLKPYVGSGNKTPVLDISSLVHDSTVPPLQIRAKLESDVQFREWLRDSGRRIGADSIMIYYPSTAEEYDFVMFVGEPGSATDSPFSDMCGNGIRALALHIVLHAPSRIKNMFIREGISIWAGEVRNVTIEDIDYQHDSGIFRVEMGPYTEMSFDFKRYSTIPHSAVYGAGFNGQTTGEPHVVILIAQSSLHEWYEAFPEICDSTNPAEITRILACKLGRQITFDLEAFPKGINTNIGIIDNDTITMSTHERNIHSSAHMCRLDQTKNGFCRCNTLACGTGGSAVANTFIKRFPDRNTLVTTIHPGGAITYDMRCGYSTMIGSAQKGAV